MPLFFGGSLTKGPLSWRVLHVPRQLPGSLSAFSFSVHDIVEKSPKKFLVLTTLGLKFRFVLLESHFSLLGARHDFAQEIKSSFIQAGCVSLSDQEYSFLYQLLDVIHIYCGFRLRKVIRVYFRPQLRQRSHNLRKFLLNMHNAMVLHSKENHSFRIIHHVLDVVIRRRRVEERVYRDRRGFQNFRLNYIFSYMRGEVFPSVFLFALV